VTTESGSMVVPGADFQLPKCRLPEDQCIRISRNKSTRPYVFRVKVHSSGSSSAINAYVMTLFYSGHAINVAAKAASGIIIFSAWSGRC